MSAPLFSMRDVTVQFGGLRAIDALSMDVAAGTIHAVIGPNGAGKSTLFNCVSRFVRPRTGDILFEGRSLLGLPAHGIAALGIARTFQNIELCGRMTVLENVLVGMTPRVPRYLPFLPGTRRMRVERAAVAAAEEILERLHLAPWRDVPAEQLDFGRQKLLDLARALSTRPKLLFLDEPAAGLRNREIAALDALLVQLARSEGVTIVLVEHVMQLVMGIADQVTVLNFGRKIAEGAPGVIRSHPDVIEAYLGKDDHAAH